MKRLLRPPRTLTITRTGRTYIVLTVGVGLGALNTGNNLLYLVLGLLLSLIIVSGVMSERCLRDLRVRRLGTHSAYAGEPFPFRWRLKRGRGSSFALSIAEAGTALSGRGTVAHLAPGADAVVRADLVSLRRGIIPLSGVTVTTNYPLGLFAKSRLFEESGILEVYPRRRPALGNHQGSPAISGGTGAPARGEGIGEVFGLTEFRDGDDSRRIHWRRTASIGRLVRRVHEREERASVVLKVKAGLPAEALETHCEDIAATADDLLHRGFEVGLETQASQLRPAAGPGQQRRILRALAWVGFEGLAP